MTLRKKRIIIDGEVLVMPHFSGIGHYTLELIKAMDAKLVDHPNLDVRIFVHFRHVEKARAFGFNNIKIVRSPFSLRVSNGLKIRNKQLPLDLLFGKGIYVFPNYSSWPLLFSKSVPFIYDLSFEKYAEFAEPRNQAFLSEQVRKSAKRSSHIATISKNSKQEIHDFYKVPLDKIGIYYPAVDTNVFFKQTDQVIAAVKKKYGITGKYILFVGNIEPRKNLKNLLLAYEQLNETIRKEYSLLLVGAKGWQDGEIFDIIRRLQDAGDSVQRPKDYVEDKDLPAIYSGASVFVYPSIYEGFGIPPIEAMACGVPTIASDNSSLPEATGDAAQLINADDTVMIRDAIVRYLSDKDLTNSHVKKGAKQVAKFSWSKSAEDIINTLSRL